MQPYSKLTPFLLLLFVLTISFAQETPKHKINSINEGSIEEQFDYISRISSNYNDKGKRSGIWSEIETAFPHSENQISQSTNSKR